MESDAVSADKEARVGPDPRIEGNYLQALMQYWVGTNAIIWQQISTTIAIQSAGIAVAYSLRYSISSVFVIVMTMTVSFMMLFQLKSNIEVRRNLKIQADYISSELLTPLFEQRPKPAGIAIPFTFYDAGFDKKYRPIRSTFAVWLVLILLMSFDAVIGFSLNYPDLAKFVASHFPVLPPLFPQNFFRQH